MRRRIPSSNVAGKKRGKLGFLITLLVVFIVVLILSSVFFVNSKRKLIESPYGIFKTLTIREAFENAFGTITVQYTTTGVKISASDQMNNRYLAEVTPSGLKIFLNGQLYSNPEEMYRLNIYGRALYNLVLLNAPVGFEGADPKAPINYLKNVTYDYIQSDGKEYIRIVGVDKDYQNVEIWYGISRVKEQFTITVEKVIVDNAKLSNEQANFYLSNMYKKAIAGDLVTIVQNASLKEYPNIPIKNVFSNLKEAKWTIKKEDEKVVELNAKDISESDKIITIGFKVEDDGFLSIQYMFIDGQQVDAQGISQYVDSLYKSFGFTPSLALENEKYKEKILSSVVPYVSPQMTFGEFFSTYLRDVQWRYEQVPEGLKYSVSGLTQDSQQLEIVFTCSGEKVYLSSISLNNSSMDVEKIKDIIAKGPISEVASVSAGQLINIVKNSKLSNASSVPNNERAFASLLTNMNWTEDLSKNTVILTGTGTYGSRKCNFKFVFEVVDGNNVMLNAGYIDNVQMVDEVRDYLISKMFNIPALSNSIVELVKNSVLNEKTYSQILGKTGWSVDKPFDRVVFNNGRLKVVFSVEENGDVKPVQLFYNNTDLSVRVLDILEALEKGKNISEVVGDINSQSGMVEKMVEKKVDEKTKSVGTDKQQKVKNTPTSQTNQETATTQLPPKSVESSKESAGITQETKGSVDPVKKINAVKQSKLQQASRFLNNERAFNTYLYDPKWTYDSKSGKVVLTGKGHYNNAIVDMKFVFSVDENNVVMLDGVYVENKKADATTTEQILEKVFFPGKTSSLQETNNEAKTEISNPEGTKQSSDIGSF